MRQLRRPTCHWSCQELTDVGQFVPGPTPSTFAQRATTHLLFTARLAGKMIVEDGDLGVSHRNRQLIESDPAFLRRVTVSMMDSGAPNLTRTKARLQLSNWSGMNLLKRNRRLICRSVEAALPRFCNPHTFRACFYVAKRCALPKVRRVPRCGVSTADGRSRRLAAERQPEDVRSQSAY